MPISVKNIIPAKNAETGDTTQYTSTNAITVIDKFTATNVSGATRTLTVNLVPGAGSPVSSNRIVAIHSIVNNDTYTFPELVGHALDEGSFISTDASGSGLTIRASGRIIT